MESFVLAKQNTCDSFHVNDRS